ncbi:hypothetical protein ACHMW6_28930 [Pseudoduganella sp. UC29_106]|uniref:hypothetical protein n=1 Tax=Pseudoduganella sp. UC29_106 TaxID=3374553 RepID=UPI003758214C
MTRFAAPDVYACPDCGSFFLRRELKSLFVVGARAWTDGAPTGWWDSALAPLVRCSACAALFWIQDLERLGVLDYPPRQFGGLERLIARWRGDPDGRLREEAEWLQIPLGWKTAREAGISSIEDISFVLAHSEGQSRGRVLWLRRHVWWALNDRFRTRVDGTPIPNVPRWPEAEERANMEALLGLLEVGEMKPGDQVQKGELLRLLGRFDEAIAVLKAVPPGGHNEIRAVKIERLAGKGDLEVRPLSEEVR